ncbi:MAG: B12-binding domain-containing radical SAM protein [Candidatus Zhuqueibacterota bacterium]
MKPIPTKKMIFIEPKSPNLHIFSVFVIPRLGTLILGTIMKQKGWDVEVIVEENEEIDFNRIASADIVGISTITSTAPRAYTIADQVRKMGITVIMGGPHVTFLPDEALEHADFVIRSEGENALPAFIEAWENGRNYSTIPNLSYLRDGKVIHNPIEKLNDNLDKIPYPDFSLIRTGIRKTFGYQIVPVQTSRGCPFDCEFCSVTGMFGRKIRYRSTENIIEELRQYDNPKNVIFFYDDNFTANRRRTKELLHAMIAEKFRFNWSTQVRADVAKDPEIIQLMHKAGCTTVFIGFESVDPASLKEMKKEQSVGEIKAAIQAFYKNKIHVHGMFVFGFESDTPSKMRETIGFVNKSHIGTVQFLILTPLPGSVTFRKLKDQGRIKFYDWGLYDAHHAVFEPKQMTIDELQKAQIRGHQSFYSLRQLFKRAIHFEWNELIIGLYARRLNRNWKKKNRIWLKVLNLLRPSHDFKINIDFRQAVRLPSRVQQLTKRSARQFSPREDLNPLGRQNGLSLEQ